MFDLLNKSDEMLRLQSILNTSFELKVLHTSSSEDQLIDTCLPHQNVSRKNVVTMAHTVKRDTAYSIFRNVGIVGGMSLKYKARIASFGQ